VAAVRWLMRHSKHQRLDHPYRSRLVRVALVEQDQPRPRAIRELPVAHLHLVRS